MSVQYLSVIISKIPEFVNFISLHDICNIRQSCNDLKIEIDKKLAITRNNEDIEVTCGNNHYKKMIINDNNTDMNYVIDPFSENIYQWVGREDYQGTMISITLKVIEDNDDRIIVINTTYIDEGDEYHDYNIIEKISNDYYCNIRQGIRYLKIRDNFITVDDYGSYLLVTTINRHITYHIGRREVVNGNLDRNDNDPFWVAINIVLKVRGI